jgi:hypothetical protein
LASKSGSLAERLAANLDLLRLSLYEEPSSGTDIRNIVAPFQYEALHGLAQCANAMTAEQCLELADQLLQLDAGLPPWSRRIENQRVIDENRGWQSHLISMLNRWSGADWYVDGKVEDQQRRTVMRMLITRLAMRAFELKRGRLPRALAELAPEFLPAVPTDPFASGQPLNYVVADRPIVYSVGRNGTDDSAGLSADQSAAAGDDLTSDLLLPELTKWPPAGSNDAGEGREATADGKSPK